MTAKTSLRRESCNRMPFPGQPCANVGVQGGRTSVALGSCFRRNDNEVIPPAGPTPYVSGFGLRANTALARRMRSPATVR